MNPVLCSGSGHDSGMPDLRGFTPRIAGFTLSTRESHGQGWGHEGDVAEI
jgi:hypothetical protein